MKTRRGRLNVATCQFHETFDPGANARKVCGQIAQAAAAGADVVHFHECALSGYGDALRSRDYDWPGLHGAAQQVMAEAKRRRVWVVVGTSHPLTPPHRPHNSLYLISPKGQLVDRYDKRFCTGGDLKTFSPGKHYSIFEINGIRCSMLICYDFRFPELYRALYSKGVRLVFHSFHNASTDRGPHVLTQVARATLQGYAGTNAMWISAANSTRRYQLWPGVFITPDGIIAGQLGRYRPGFMVHTVDPAESFYDASGPWRKRALRGVLHSGRTVADTRSADRTRL